MGVQPGLCWVLVGNPEDRFCHDSAHLSAMFSVHLAWQIGIIAQSEARQGGMQGTKSLTPHVELILSLRFGHKMIHMDFLPLPWIHEEQLSDTGER